MCGSCHSGPAPVVVYVDQTATLTQLAAIKALLEELMANEVEQFTALNAKVDDLIADVRAALEALAGQVSPEGQAVLDDLNAKLDAFDAEVGDADGSDTPVPPPPV